MAETAETISHQTVSGYMEECYTESIFNAAQLRAELWEGRGNPEWKLKQFYNSFYQLYCLTKYKVEMKNPDNQSLALIDEWFDIPLDTKDRQKTAKMGKTGIRLFSEWLKLLSKTGVLVVK